MKGISLIEQHIEKLVVAILAIVLVAVLGMQFLTAPNRVPMGGEEVDPAGIESRLRAKADSIRGRLAGGGADEPLVEGGIPKVADDFIAGLDRPVSPRPELPPIDHSLAASLLPSDVSSGDVTFHVPRFPPLDMVEVRQESATIKASVVSDTAGLSELLPSPGSSGDVDLTWSIPVARIDLKGIRGELRAARSGTSPIPELWYNGNLFLVDLVFERQELGEAGWGEATAVSPLPGKFSLRKELGKADADLRDEVFRLLGSRERSLAILQPDFYETVREVFTAGAVLGMTDAAAEGDSDEVKRLKRSLSEKEVNLKRVEADLKELGGPLRGSDEKDKRKGDRPGRGDDSGQGGGGGGGSKTPGSGMGFGSGTAGGKRGVSGSGTADDEATRSRRRLLTNQFDRLTADVERLKAELAKLKPDAVASSAQDAEDLAKSDSLLVWGHDLGIQPGATYRYRVRAEIYNPFFARKRQLTAEQAPLADAFTLRTEVSEWGEPVRIEPEVSFFLVDASPGEGRLGLGSARFEIFRYIDGERRRESFVVQPGDRIGDERSTGPGRREVDFGTDWFVVDVVDGLPVEGRGEARNRTARVVVADSAGRTMFRFPGLDSQSPLRVKFNDQVEAARVAASEESEPKAPEDGEGEGAATPPAAGGPAGR